MSTKSAFFGREHPPIGEQYRDTTLGTTLKATLDELIQHNKMTIKAASKILLHFDVGMNAHLTRCASRVTFRATNVQTYKEFKKVYTIILNNFEVFGRGRAMPIHVDGLEKVMIIAHPSSSTLLKKKVTNPTENAVDEVPSKSSTTN